MKPSALRSQKKLALALLDWHGGQSSGLYAVGSCMLSDSDNAREYQPANHHGHADSGEHPGELTRAIWNLRNLRRDANYPECFTAADERTCNALADRLASLYSCHCKQTA